MDGIEDTSEKRPHECQGLVKGVGERLQECPHSRFWSTRPYRIKPDRDDPLSRQASVHLMADYLKLNCKNRDLSAEAGFDLTGITRGV